MIPNSVVKSRMTTNANSTRVAPSSSRSRKRDARPRGEKPELRISRTDSPLSRLRSPAAQTLLIARWNTELKVPEAVTARITVQWPEAHVPAVGFVAGVHPAVVTVPELSHPHVTTEVTVRLLPGWPLLTKSLMAAFWMPTVSTDCTLLCTP